MFVSLKYKMRNSNESNFHLHKLFAQWLLTFWYHHVIISPDKSKYRKLQLELKLVQVHMDQSWSKMAGKHKVSTNKGKDILQAKF